MAACQAIGILTYREASAELPRAIAGLTDITARRLIRNQVESNKLTFSVPFSQFRGIGANAAERFLEGEVWQ